jgi:intracellular sulfur oxidation DsrE/DsrF family protein
METPMNRRSLFLATAISLGAVALGGCAAPQQASAPHRVVFQVSDNDPARWNLALNNAKNVQQEYGSRPVQVEIVAYGPGIGMLKADAVTANRVTEATAAGVQVVACQNTMKAQKLNVADMNASVGYVPAGVVELMTRQREGWAYIRP